MKNSYIESFSGRLRDECLNMEVFFTLADVREKLERWRQDYNQVRRLSRATIAVPVVDPLSRIYAEIVSITNGDPVSVLGPSNLSHANGLAGIDARGEIKLPERMRIAVSAPHAGRWSSLRARTKTVWTADLQTSLAQR